MPQWPTDLKAKRLKQKEVRRNAKDPYAWLRADIQASEYKRNEAQSVYRYQTDRLVKLRQRLRDLQEADGVLPDVEFGEGPLGPPGAEAPKVTMK